MVDQQREANSPLAGAGATDLAAVIRDGHVSAREVVEAHIAKVEEVDKQLNAVVVRLFDRALAEAKAAEEARSRGEALGPLHGVPITIKEQFLVAGTPTTFGLSHLAGSNAERDGPLVARLRSAGAIVIGKTNVPQLLLEYESHNALYGRTNNPWNLDRTPGGSSGGEAAVIAAGGSSLGLGGDLGGSIRVPSHFCGISGLKPTSGRFTNLDTPAHIFGALVGMEAIVAQPGPMAPTVEDLRLAMSVLMAPTAEVLPDLPPPVPWSDGSDVPIEGLRVGMYSDDGFFAASPAVRRAVEEAAEALRSRGAQVELFTPPDVAEAVSLFNGILTSGGGSPLRRSLGRDRPSPQIKAILQGADTPRALRGLLSGLLALMGQERLRFILRNTGRRATLNYWELVARRTAYRARFLAAVDEGSFDVIICPPYATPAPRHGDTVDLVAASSYAILYNLLGMPAGVVAATRVGAGEETDRPDSRDRVERKAREVELGSAGLPVGVQVVAKHWREDLVLTVMEALEGHFKADPSYPSQP